MNEWCLCCEQALDPDALEAGEETCSHCQREAEGERAWEEESER